MEEMTENYCTSALKTYLILRNFRKSYKEKRKKELENPYITHLSSSHFPVLQTILDQVSKSYTNCSYKIQSLEKTQLYT